MTQSSGSDSHLVSQRSDDFNSLPVICLTPLPRSSWGNVQGKHYVTQMLGHFPAPFCFQNPLSDVGLASPQASRTGKDWTPASGKGVRKDGCLYPQTSRVSGHLEERWASG